MKTQKEFEFSYGGGNSIDINTLLTSQFHFLAILNELQKELSPASKLNIKVTGFKKGSFVIQMVLEGSFINELFNADNAKALGGILMGAGSLFKIYKYLKGDKADKIKEIANDNIEIHCKGDNNSITVNKNIFNIYRTNTVVNNAINKNFELLEDAETITDIKITETGQKKPIVKVDRSDFENLTKPNSYLDKNQDEQIYIEEMVFIKKPNLFPDKNHSVIWEFLHKGRDIKAKITDINFIREINDGIKVGQGDRLIVDLKIYYKWEDKYNTFIEANKFEILKVHKKESRNTQIKLI